MVPLRRQREDDNFVQDDNRLSDVCLSAVLIGDLATAPEESLAAHMRTQLRAPRGLIFSLSGGAVEEREFGNIKKRFVAVLRTVTRP